MSARDDGGPAFPSPAPAANARLIAAAPDLLAALKALDAYWCEMLPDGPPADTTDHWLHADSVAVWRTVRAAIAKAEGGAA